MGNLCPAHRLAWCAPWEFHRLIELTDRPIYPPLSKTRDLVRKALAPLTVYVDYTDIYGTEFPLLQRPLGWFGRHWEHRENARQKHRNMRSIGRPCKTRRDRSGSASSIMVTRATSKTKRASQHCDKLLLVLSSHSMNGKWVKTEISMPGKMRSEANAASFFPSAWWVFRSSETRGRSTLTRAKTRGGKYGSTSSPTSRGWKDHDAYTKAFDQFLPTT